jgi:hypothetical protein
MGRHPKALAWATAGLLTCALLAGCPMTPVDDGGAISDGGGGDGGGARDAGATDAGDVGPDAGASACDVDGFGPTAGGNYLTTGLGDFLLLYDGTEPPLRKVQLELYGGSRTPLTHTIAGENFSDCEVCLSLLDACASPTGECDVQYFAEVGTVSITTYDDGLIEGVLTGIEAVEVTIDPDTFVSTPVPGGGRWCLEALTFSQVVEE